MTPVGRPALTYENQSWKEKPNNDSEEPEESVSKTSESKKSKAKRVKNFLKNKYKTAIGSKSSSSDQSPSGDSASWYLERITVQSEVSEVDEVFEEACETLGEIESLQPLQVANVILIKNPTDDFENRKGNLDDDKVKNDSEDTNSGVASLSLTTVQEEIDGSLENEILDEGGEIKKVSKN